MKLHKRFLLGGIAGLTMMVVAGLAFMSDLGAKAGGPSGVKDPAVNQYAAEWLCGNIPPSPPGPFPLYLGPGAYHTEISVHNPNADPVFIQKKVVPLPFPESPGGPTARQRFPLNADNAFHMDCTDISTFFPGGICPTAIPPMPDFCKGYAVIEAATTPTGSPAQLDVTVTITRTNPTTGDVSLDFEFVTAKKVNYPCWSNLPPVCPP